MHDQSASRISGRTRAAVSAMCVRALRITVLKSAGNFTRDECHDLSAEKIQRVKCFMFTRCGICCVLAIFERRRGRLGSKISGYGQLAEVAVYFAMSGLPPEADTKRKGRHVRWVPANSGHWPNDRDGHGSLARRTKEEATHPANSLPVRDSQLRRPTRRCRADRPIERSLNSRRACHRRWSGPARPWRRHWPNRH
jgi:hypothetical protein